MRNKLILFPTQSPFALRCISLCSLHPIARRCRPPSSTLPSHHLSALNKSIHLINCNNRHLSTAQPTFSSFHPPLHPATIHALTHKLKHVHPTEIQTKAYQAAITNRDVLARARTGTGKTLAFLLPSIENALRSLTNEESAKRKRGVQILILCPTRELASQIHSTSQSLAASHSNSPNSIRMHTQVMFGGVSKEKDVQKLEEKLPFVLVATPGRLLDHLEGTRVGGRGFGEILGGIGVLVLDEVSSFGSYRWIS